MQRESGSEKSGSGRPSKRRPQTSSWPSIFSLLPPFRLFSSSISHSISNSHAQTQKNVSCPSLFLSLTIITFFYFQTSYKQLFSLYTGVCIHALIDHGLFVSLLYPSPWSFPVDLCLLNGVSLTLCMRVGVYVRVRM
jgi:hypothetical protein